MTHNNFSLHKRHITYYGFTYPFFLQNKIVWKLWKRFFCARNCHLFGEVAGSGHYLSCSACNTMIYIKSVELKYVEKKLRDSLEKDSLETIVFED